VGRLLTDPDGPHAVMLPGAEVPEGQVPHHSYSNSRLQAADHPDVFAAGDVAAVTRPASGQILPMLAPVAIQSGRHAGEQVARLISGQSLTDFGYRDKGVMAVLGRGEAGSRGRPR
jgi:NADH dehydrogenase FAD-containing subunit